MNKLNEALALLAVVSLLGCASESGSMTPDENRQGPALDNPADNASAATAKPSPSAPAAVDNPVDTGSAATGKPAPSTPTTPAPSAAQQPQQPQQQACGSTAFPVVRAASGTGSSNSCMPSVVAELFSHGLCSCSNAVFTGRFSIDAFNSARTSAAAALPRASVGINQQLLATGAFDIGGSLIAAGDGPLYITSGDFEIDGNFETNADVSVTGSNIVFGRDLWVNGELNMFGRSHVEGDVYQTPGHAFTGVQLSGRLVQRDFMVPAPCACAANQLLDIDTIVRDGLASSGASGGSAFNLSSGGTRGLGCGNHAYRDLHVLGSGTIKVDGPTTMFVDGDLTVTGSVAIELDSQAELDVFVTGNLLLTGSGKIGSRTRPSALRFYVGGAGDIAITGSNEFAANLYAPRSNVYVTGADEIYGSFFVGSYTATGAQAMHYDSSIQEVGKPVDCAPPPAKRCSVDPECPSPLVCIAGDCKPLVIEPD